MAGARPSMVEEGHEHGEGRIGELFLGHVTASVEEVETCVGEGALELDTDGGRHDPVVTTPQEQGRNVQ